MTAAPPPTACPQHPAELAFVHCERCARPACAYCLPESAGGQLCADCAARDAAPGVIAWERSDLNVFARLWRTTRDVLTKTEQTLAQLGEGSVTAAVSYAVVLQVALSVAALLLLSPCVLLAALGWQTPFLGPTTPMLVPIFAGAVCGSPIFAAAGGALHALLLGAVFHLASRALGGTGAYATSARVAAYALAVQVVWLLLGPAAVVPVVGPFVFGVVCFAQLFWLGSALTNVARTQHRLSDARARIAGFAPSALIVLLLALTLVALRLAAAVVDPTQGPDVYR
jgi:hypothetical protein